ncbi:MAG: hypothetical protein ABIG28_02665 [archaeon]
MNYIKRFGAFLKEDTWPSWIVSLILLVAIIKFIFFPALSFITSSPLPLVVIESCSLYHGASFDSWWNSNGVWYENKGITKSDFESFHYKNGLNKGDIIFVWGRTDYNIGDIIVFQPNPEATAPHPIIHRIIQENPFGTKGDHNFGQLTFANSPQKIDETSIPEEKIFGKATFKVPLLGWIKLVFFEPFRESQERGFCR